MSKTKEKKTVWFGMKLTPEQKEKIRTLARRRGVSQKRAVLDLVEKEVEEEQVKPVADSFYERNKDLIGAAEGPGDLSTNPKYMKGYGK
ncbi:MAG TPA: hypothetical protein VFG39_04670 [Balneolaceae bacterium]|nr:hypothetical protein [Balneolaceae bacterium]